MGGWVDGGVKHSLRVTAARPRTCTCTSEEEPLREAEKEDSIEKETFVLVRLFY